MIVARKQHSILIKFSELLFYSENFITTVALMVVEIYLAMSAVLMRIDSVKSIEKAINISHKLPGEKGLKLEVQRVKEEIATSSVSHPQSLQVDQQRSSKCSVPPPPIVQELLIISLRPLTVSARK